MIVIVSDYVDKAINININRFLKDHPDLGEFRQALYDDMLRIYDKHGIVPKIVKMDLEEGLDDSVIGSLP